MKATLEPLSKLVGMPRNPKAHNIGDIHQSYDRFGFVNRIICNEVTGHIVAGHGRIEALRQRKLLAMSIPVGVSEKPDDWYVPADWVNIPEAEEEALAIALNKIGEGEWNDVETAQILADLAAQDKLEGTGFDGNDVDQLLKNLAPSIEPEEEKEKWIRLKVSADVYNDFMDAKRMSHLSDNELVIMLMSEL